MHFDDSPPGENEQAIESATEAVEEERSRKWPLPTIIAVLFISNILLFLYPAFTVLIAVAATAGLVAIAKISGHTMKDIGVTVTKKSVVWAAIIGVTIWVGWILIAWISTKTGLSEVLLKDSRVTQSTLNGIMWSLVVVIPVGTVLLEEVGFRGVLMKEIHSLSHGKVKHPFLLAGAIASLLFGFWHIGPAMAQANAGGLSGWATVGLVAVTVVFTAISGGLFSWLRHHTKSLIAPAALHGAVNAAGLLVVWGLARGFFG